MKCSDIQEKFNELWASKITNIDFDILSNNISVDIEILDSGKTSKHTIEFQEVASYFFVNNTGDKRKEFVESERGDFLELTSVNIIEYNSEIKPKSQEKWLEQYYSQANIVIEIWSRLLLIEARHVLINSELYKLTA